jgi:enoyl-CoA hydratase
VLDRPEVANAADKALLYGLNDAFDRAAHDDDIRVIILAAEGRHFSSGHDLRDRTSMREFTPVTCASGFERPGAEGWMAMEEELYLGLCWRWRNIPKPTIAQVQGKVILGALMLVWVCDLVVASDDAEFSDPAVAFGMNGHELFTHPWEVGPRKAKEMLFTGDPISAQEARQLGMVNHVVAGTDLASHTEQLAARIADSPSLGLKLAKESVNHALEAQGQWTAIRAAFGLHQLGHSHNMQLHGRPVDPAGIQIIRDRNAPRAKRPDEHTSPPESERSHA